MEDLIKRGDAIKAMEQRYEDILRIFKRKVKVGEKAIVLDMIGCIKMLPSADRPSGEWIFKTIFPNDKREFPMGYLVCSVCGSHHSNSTPCNYCDNCGARMKGAEDADE